MLLRIVIADYRRRRRRRRRRRDCNCDGDGILRPTLQRIHCTANCTPDCFHRETVFVTWGHACSTRRCLTPKSMMFCVEVETLQDNVR